jgi:hypothetical protein
MAGKTGTVAIGCLHLVLYFIILVRGIVVMINTSSDLEEVLKTEINTWEETWKMMHYDLATVVTGKHIRSFGRPGAPITSGGCQ